MKIYLGSDHGGYQLKEQVKQWLDEWDYDFEDFGPLDLDPEDDYPDYAIPLAEKVAGEPDAIGILLCRSGGGMIIAANKVPGIRAVAVETDRAAVHAKEHNNANIISLSADWLDAQAAKSVLKTFLETPFTNAQRHQRRLAKISQYERARN
jgi:ribose 5-phosphate isomerase B